MIGKAIDSTSDEVTKKSLKDLYRKVQDENLRVLNLSKRSNSVDFSLEELRNLLEETLRAQASELSKFGALVASHHEEYDSATFGIANTLSEIALRHSLKTSETLGVVTKIPLLRLAENR